MHRILGLLIAFIICQANCDTNYRLNTPIRPSAYTILITPYFDTNDTTAFTFDGEVKITIATLANANVIKIHSEDLQFTASNITVSSGNNVIALKATGSLDFDTNYTFAFIYLEDELQTDTNYTLAINYKGPMRQDLNGFYRNYYYEKGVKKWLGATQMEPTHARKVFPCFDEPDLKATFTLSIIRPGHFEPSLTNTELQDRDELPDGNILEIFYPSPIMSTYLVAFLVSEFKPAMNTTINGRAFGIYTRSEAANQSEYAFDFGVKVVEALGDFFQIDYYSTDDHLKLDHVALIDFRAGAMENWGLIKYREALLLYDPEVSTPYYKYRVAQIVAHETTHMWFGNLVTCHWWSNTWLNEGFANYFQDYITAMIDPDVGAADALVTGSVYAAYDADDSPDAPPISNDNVNSPAEITGHFGTVTYQKAGSVIRMMHHFIGDEAFKMGLNSYLTNKPKANVGIAFCSCNFTGSSFPLSGTQLRIHAVTVAVKIGSSIVPTQTALNRRERLLQVETMIIQFSNGYPNTMYAALDQGVNTTNSLAAYHVGIADVMHSWISKAGHPLLKVFIDYDSGEVQLTQKRFYEDSSYSSNETYEIPITYTTELSPQFNDTKPAFVMSAESHNFTIPNISSSHPWIIFNVQETGLYRVDYDRHSWSIISSALKGEKREALHHLNRAKIVNDLFALFHSDEEKFEVLYDILEFLEHETDYSVWYAAIRNLHKLRSSYLGTDALKDVDDYILQVLEPIIDKLGYTVKTGDDYKTLRNRMQVLELACKLDHQGCVNNAIVLFRNFKDNDTEITPSLHPVAYCHGLRFGSASDYDYLWERMSTTNVANEARVIADALACTADEQKLKSYLVSMLLEDSPIRTQDLTVPISGVLSNYSNVHLVMEALRNNYTLWSTIYPSMDAIFVSVASALHTEEEFKEFEEILTSCSECNDETLASARKALDAAKKVVQWAEDHKEDILKSLRNVSVANLPTLIVMFGGLLITMLRKF